MRTTDGSAEQVFAPMAYRGAVAIFADKVNE
jgi:hypothetical protein